MEFNMNIVILSGKLINVRYNFIYRGKNTSIAKGLIIVDGKKLLVTAIDNLADELYRNNQSIIIVQGRIYENNIIINSIEKIE